MTTEVMQGEQRNWAETPPMNSSTSLRYCEDNREPGLAG